MTAKLLVNLSSSIFLTSAELFERYVFVIETIPFDDKVKTLTSEGNSESLIKWSEIQTMIISHIYLSKNTWGAKI